MPALFEQLPERDPLALRLVVPPGYRDHPGAERQTAPRRRESVDRLERNGGERVSMEKVVNAMAARVHPGDERRPRHWAERRHRRFKGRETPGLGKASEVWKSPLTHELSQEPVVHAIDAEHDDATVILGPDGLELRRREDCQCQGDHNDGGVSDSASHGFSG